LLFAALASAAKSAPPATSPYVVSVGDSYISGEAGRWAGNLSESVISWASWKGRIDALGSSAYHDNAAGKAESIPGCHRSKSAGIHIGSAYAGSRNFACSGAITTTVKKDSNGRFKPGLDLTAGRSSASAARTKPGATTKGIELSRLPGKTQIQFQ
jgi:hypothetical protein